jgi:hypothetical protein
MKIIKAQRPREENELREPSQQAVAGLDLLHHGQRDPDQPRQLVLRQAASQTVGRDPPPDSRLVDLHVIVSGAP